MPTMSAPASSRVLAALGGVHAFGGFVFILEADRDHHRQPGFPPALHRQQRLADPRKSFPDDEIHACVDLNGELLIKSPAHAIRRRRASRLVHPREAQIARHQALVARHLSRDADRGAIQIFQPVLQSRRSRACRGWHKT